MSSLILVNSNAEFEIVNPDVEFPLADKEVEIVVNHFPANSFGCFFNDIFEDENFVFILNGQWKFWDNKKFEFEDWDWKKDCDAIIQEYMDDQDLDSISEFSNGWIYSDGEQFPPEVHEYILEHGNINSKPVYLEVKALLSEVQTDEDKALLILRERGLSDLEKVQKILKLR